MCTISNTLLPLILSIHLICQMECKQLCKQTQFIDSRTRTVSSVSVGLKGSSQHRSALLSVMNGLLLVADAGHSSVVVHLDLYAAFYTTDHSIPCWPWWALIGCKLVCVLLSSRWNCPPGCLMGWSWGQILNQCCPTYYVAFGPSVAYTH